MDADGRGRHPNSGRDPQPRLQSPPMLRTRLLLGPLLLGVLFGVFWIDETFLPQRLLVPATGVRDAVGGPGHQPHRRVGAQAALPGPWASASPRGMLMAGAIVGMCVPWILPDTLQPLTAFTITGTAAAGVLVMSMVWHSRTRSSKGVLVARGRR